MLIIVVSIVLFGSYAGLRFATLPVLAYSCNYSQITSNSAVLLPASATIYESTCV